MKKLLFFVLCCMFNLLGYSQGIQYDNIDYDSLDLQQTEYVDNRSGVFFRISSGYNGYIFSNRESEVEVESNKMSLPISLGIGYDFPISEYNMIVAEVSFTRVATKLVMAYEEYSLDAENINVFTGRLSVNTHNYLLQLPVYFRFHLNQNFNWTVGINNTMTISMGSELDNSVSIIGYNKSVETKETSEVNKTIYLKDKYRVYNFGIILGASVRLWESDFMLNVRSYYDFMSMLKDEEKEKILNYGTGTLNNFALMLGITYDIKFGELEKTKVKNRQNDPNIIFDDNF